MIIGRKNEEIKIKGLSTGKEKIKLYCCHGNIWDRHKNGAWICITTNGTIRGDGACIMGRGVALQAKRRYPQLPYEIGANIARIGNHCCVLKKYKIITFPVKWRYNNKANINLISESAHELMEILDKHGIYKVYLPKPGCNNGKLDWNDVKAVIETILDERVIIVDKNESQTKNF